MRQGLIILPLLALWACAASASAEDGRASPAAHIMAERFAAAEQTSPGRPSIDYEIEMLKRARAEQAARQAAEQRAQEPIEKPVEKPVEKTVETGAEKPADNPQHRTLERPDQPVAPSTGLTASQPQKADDDTGKTSAAPPRSTSPPAEQIKPSQAPQRSHSAEPTGTLINVELKQDRTPPAATAAAPRQAEAAVRPQAQAPESALADAAPEAATRATLMLLFDDPGSATVFDPLICIGETCHVSSGLDAKAVALSKADAAKLTSTKGVTPDPCRGKSACVYRDVALDDDARLAVIHAGVRERAASGTGFTIALDASCTVRDGTLGCGEPLATPDYRVWIVPEETAIKAGPAALEDAIANGLPRQAAPAGDSRDK